MPLRKTSQLPAPKSWEEFEMLCCDLFRCVWQDPGTQRNGRTGQPQHGVDVFGRPNQGIGYAGVQARNKIQLPTGLNTAELFEEVDKAKSFAPPLTKFILATTAPNDAKIQQEARLLTAEQITRGSFPVEVWGWAEMESRIAEYPELLQQYYPQFAEASESEAQELVRVLREQAQWSEEKDRPTFERTNVAMSTMAANFQPSWNIRQASGDYVPNLEWRFCGPRFQMDWRAADGSALKRTTITEAFDLTAARLIEHRYVGTDEIGLEIRFPWRGKIRHEIHRWPLNFSVLAEGQVCDVGREMLLVLRFDENLES